MSTAAESSQQGSTEKPYIREQAESAVWVNIPAKPRVDEAKYPDGLIRYA